MERGRVFISKSHLLFRDVLQANVEIGSIFRHRFQFQAKFVPIIVRVLFPIFFGYPVVDSSVGCLLHRLLLDVEVDVDVDVCHSLACCV